MTRATSTCHMPTLSSPSWHRTGLSRSANPDASKWKILDMIGISTIRDVSHPFFCRALSFGRTFGLSTGWRASRMLRQRSEVLSGEKALPPCLGEVTVLPHIA